MNTPLLPGLCIRRSGGFASGISCLQDTDRTQVTTTPAYQGRGLSRQAELTNGGRWLGT